MRIDGKRRARLVCVVGCGCLLGQGAGLSLGQRAGQRSNDLRTDDTRAFRRLEAPRIVAVEPAASPATIMRIDADALSRFHRSGQKVRVSRFPIPGGRAVELELIPFDVVGPDTRFVMGRSGGPDRPFAYDTGRVSMFHGRVVGRPGSHVYLSLGRESSTGYVDLGPGSPRHRISSRGGDGRALGPSLLSVFRATGGGSGPAGVPFCGVEGTKVNLRGEWIDVPVASLRPAGARAGVSTSTVGLRQMELAIDTDYELFTRFDDATATADYVVQMYGEVSAIFMRDVRMHIEIVFVRVWDHADDLFNGPDPLGQFYPWWSLNMGAVDRDAVQFFSGRRDFPFGGQAFIAQLCAFSYGVVGYVVGAFPDPTIPDPFNWDVSVTAHELGHTCNAIHTHSNGIDTCDNPNTTPRRGPLMSYCGQTWSGMNANTDNYFHTVSRADMDVHISESVCIVADCNMNNVDDAVDIAGASADTNGNGVPDECEDCNNNGTLDPLDVAGASLDLNGNGIPDECEPDCNNNNVPDDRDIALGTSSDVYGNGIPDECEADCNNNGTSDYSEIQTDITLDKDRDAVLDACQDCDNDGTTDLDALGGAHQLWVATGLSNQAIRMFLGSTGVRTAISIGGGPASVNAGQDLIVRSDGSILVTSADDHRVMQFNASGAYVGDFVSTGSGGLSYPTGLIVSPAGRLLVSSRDTHSVLAFDGTSGAPQGAFVADGSGGLLRPFGLTYGPNGNLFVTSDNNEVIEYDGGTGAFVRVFVLAANNGGLSQPRGLAFKPDGNLLVASYGTDEVLEYGGADGHPRGKWAHVGTETRITQDSPWGIRIGPNGHVFVTRTGSGFAFGSALGRDVGASHLTDARMFEYDVCTGDFRKTEIGGNDHGLNFATGFDFVPGFTIDCNVNEIPDNCDIDSGDSEDTDLNGVPDECQVDCNSNGTYDRLDIYPYGSSLDCNCNFIPDECDLASATSTDCNLNGTPDECEINLDCNENGIQDLCEVFAGTADDCNENAYIDACEPGSNGLILNADFESGVPSGWTTNGIFSVTSSCPAGGAGGGVSWAYAGDTGSCTYGDGEAGSLVSPIIHLPPGNPELRYSTAYVTEQDFDFADVVVNNIRVDRLHGGSGVWEDRTVDLTRFAGRPTQIIFRIQSDAGVSGTLGWLVDNVEVIAQVESCATNPPTVGDDTCWDGGINTGDPCSVDADCGAGPVCGLKSRHISFAPGDAPTVGSSEVAYRVEIVGSIDYPASVGRVYWLGDPVEFDEGPTGGVYFGAALQCPMPAARDWSAEDLVHAYGEAVVPNASYEVRAATQACIDAGLIDCMSDPLSIATGIWADIVAPFATAIDPDFGDISSEVEKFQSKPGAPIKPRALLCPQSLDALSAVGFDQISACVASFKGKSYAQTCDPPPTGPPTCP